MRASLYVHVPVCLKKCDYCDFFSIPLADFPANASREGRFNPFVRAIHREIGARARRFSVSAWNTLYIGGGTPSLLDPTAIYELASPLTPGTEESTIEANPEDITGEWLDACQAAGIGRLSLGMQSLRDETLNAIGRRGSAASNRSALGLVKKRWRGSVSVDFISGMPGQTRESLLADLREALSFNVDHVSLYSLTIGEGTPLEAHIRAGKFAIPGNPSLPDEEEAAAAWISGRDFLENRGYAQYEVSNFAKPGRESRHNETYWRLESYIGVGPGATGTIAKGDEAIRITNRENVERWLNDPENAAEEETIPRESCILESILMGMRMKKGVDRGRFMARYGVDFADLVPKTIRDWTSKGLCVLDGESVALTKEGLLVLNRFLVDCAAEL